MKHLIPDDPLAYRQNASKTVTGTHLKKLAQELLIEIAQRKTEFTHFKVLKRSDFNTRLASGVIILKYKEFPFVIKLFLKTPGTFVRQSEGIIQKFFFRMGGGTNRHLTGFTRIPNREKILEKIKQSPKWSDRIDIPRKWYWLPENPQWIVLEGKNIGPNGICETVLPAAYGIIADAIESTRSLHLRNKQDRDIALSFAQDIGNRVDAHVDNLMEEKGTGKLLLVDTEHFPSMVGLKEPLEFDSYSSWYLQLSAKCFKDNFLRHKKMRRELQSNARPEIDAVT
jgi:hypothetical protein